MRVDPKQVASATAAAHVSQSAFVRNPAAAMSSAVRGTLVITDAHGKPRGVLSVPCADRRPLDLDE